MSKKESIISRNLLFFGHSNITKILDAKIAIVGVGGLGCVVAETLTRLGVKNLILIDKGIIDEPDLGRQILYDLADIGKKKVVVAKNKLTKRSGITKVEGKFTDVFNLSKKELDRCDCVVDCLDNFKSRFELEKRISDYKPLIHGGIQNDYGQITTIVKKYTPLLKEIYADADAKTTGTIPVSTPAVFTIASLMAQEVINNVLGVPQLINIMLIVELSDFSFTKIKLEK